MQNDSTQGGFILVNMMGPILMFAAVVAGVVWLLGTYWDAFPPMLQLGFKVLGMLLVLALIIGNAIASRGPNGGRRGF